jgi:hypothetical protein
MRLFIAAIVAVLSGCAGGGVTETATLGKASSDKTWTQDAFESKGGGGGGY